MPVCEPSALADRPALADLANLANFPKPAGERVRLDATSWVDVVRGFLPDPGPVYDELAAAPGWRQGRLWRYDHYEVENRLTAGGATAAHPAVRAAGRELHRHYRVGFDGPALAWYRSGREALGAHRDRELRYTADTLVVILTLGARRPFLLQPRGARTRAAPVDLAPGAGDLLVMGGRAQADWLHGVPPVPSLRDGRISVQWRWTSRLGPPERGPGYRAPRHYSRG